MTTLSAIHSTSCPVAEVEEPSFAAIIAGDIRRHPFLVAMALTLLTIAVYIATMHYTTGGDTIPNELLPIVLLNGYGFDFTEVQPHNGPFPYYFKLVKDRVVSFYPIVPGLLNVPVYALAKWAGVNLRQMNYPLSGLTCAWISGVSVGFMYLVLSRACRSVWTASGFTLIFAFATQMWSVTSRCLWQHGPSVLFLSGAMALLMSKSMRWLPYCGFFLGMAVWNRPTNVVFALPIAVYMIVHHRDRLVPFFVSAAIPALALAIYSQVYWGSVLVLGQGHRMNVQHGPSVTNFDGPLFAGLAGLLFSPSRGLFIFGPMFLFSFAYLARALRSNAVPPLYRYLAIGVILDLILFAKWSVWWGGYSFGYRMLIELLPAMVLFGAAAWEGGIVRGWPLKLTYVMMVVVSVYVHFLGAFYYPSGFNYIPDSVDDHRARLWWWRDTEITRCHELFMTDLRQLFASKDTHR